MRQEEALAWDKLAVFLLRPTVGLFVGRFQPLHRGHLEAIKDLMKKVDELVIVIGSSQYSHTLENPFTAGERVKMVRLALAETGIDAGRCYIIPVADVNVHNIWVAHVVAHTPRFDVVFTNEPLTRRLFIDAGFKVKPIKFHDRGRCSATNIRERMLKGKSWEALVPKSVAKFIKQINGAERLRELQV